MLSTRPTPGAVLNLRNIALWHDQVTFNPPHSGSGVELVPGLGKKAFEAFQPAPLRERC